MPREDCEDVKGKSAILMPVSPKKLTYYQDYDGDLNFAMDAWMSPNHRAYIAISVHLVWNGELLILILDIVEVAKVKTPTLPNCNQLLRRLYE